MSTTYRDHRPPTWLPTWPPDHEGSSMHIDWATLGAIAVVAAAAALTVVLLVAFALVGLSARTGRRGDGPDDDGTSGTHTATGTSVAALCLLAAGLIVCYGLYLIIA